MTEIFRNSLSVRPTFVAINLSQTLHILPSELISIENFCLVGINYKNADTSSRGGFVVSDEQYEAILEEAKSYGIRELFVLSTCNRTEIYGCTPDVAELQAIICNHTEGDAEYFAKRAYRKRGKDAIGHIFHVAAGLDSQILGDYEIVGQLKRAIVFAQERGYVGIFTDRLFKYVLQSCRAIRSKTKLSSGTVSVAYAAVLFLKGQIRTTAKENILVVGLGKIGKNTCKNLLTTFPNCRITLINRTLSKAEEIAESLGNRVDLLPFDELTKAVHSHKIIIVATNAPVTILNRRDFDRGAEKILMDLSIPNNIDASLKEYPNIKLVNVDDLSKVNDQTLLQRKKEVPAAKNFIVYYIHQFAEWYLMRKNVPVLKEVKEKLLALNRELEIADNDDDKVRLQKIINDMAAKMRHKGMPSGCYYIEAINGYLEEMQSVHHHQA